MSVIEQFKCDLCGDVGGDDYAQVLVAVEIGIRGTPVGTDQIDCCHECAVKVSSAVAALYEAAQTGCDVVYVLEPRA